MESVLLSVGFVIGVAVSVTTVYCGVAARMKVCRTRIAELCDRRRTLQLEAAQRRERLALGPNYGAQVDEKRLLLHELNMRLPQSQRLPWSS
jgi:hypothetical protein